MILRAALCMKLYSARSIRGVSTHFSGPNIRTACTTSLKKFPDTLLSAPSLLKTRDIHPQLFRAFAKFPTTAVQSSSPVVITRPRYLKVATVSSGFP